MVHIGLLATKFANHSNRRIVEEGNKLGYQISKIDPRKICLFIDNKLSYSFHGKLGELDVILPRFGGLKWDFSIMALNHFEKMGIPLVNSPYTEVVCKNKYLTSLLLKQKKIAQPNVAVAISEKELFKFVKKMAKPLVLKVIDGTHGKGVSRINDDSEAEDWFETIEGLKEPIYIQEYIPHPGEDYRLLIINDQVFASMKRLAKKNEWKANINLGAIGLPYKPTKEIKELALRCSKAVKADVCGVDIIIHDGIAKVIEVNHNPGFKGLEKASKKNVARAIVKFAAKKAKK